MTDVATTEHRCARSIGGDSEELHRRAGEFASVILPFRTDLEFVSSSGKVRIHIQTIEGQRVYTKNGAPGEAGNVAAANAAIDKWIAESARFYIERIVDETMNNPVHLLRIALARRQFVADCDQFDQTNASAGADAT